MSEEMQSSVKLRKKQIVVERLALKESDKTFLSDVIDDGVGCGSVNEKQSFNI